MSITGSTELPAGGVMRIHIGSGTATGTTEYWGLSKGILDNGGDYVMLRKPDGTPVEAYYWS